MSEPVHQLPHGCPQMIAAVADPRVPLRYLPRFREYGLAIEGGSTIQEIHFCPFCGAKLPASLRDAFFENLEAMEMEPENPALPAELRSDAWWRAREGPASS